MDFCICGSMKKEGKCTNKHCLEKNDKCKNWVAGGRSMNFIKPVTYEEAANQAEKIRKSEMKFLK
jgi:hypothetical protein